MCNIGIISTFQSTHEAKPKPKESGSFTCWVCLESNTRKTYKTKHQLETHIKCYHKIPRNRIDFSKMPEATPGGVQVKEESSAPGGGEVNHEEGAESDTPPAVKRLRLDGESVFNCAKCTFTCESREDFQTHIRKHLNSETGSMQCRECGMCFVVQPSLKRHLFMVHKIRNFKKYQEESGLDLESPVKEPVVKLRPVRIPSSARVQNGLSGGRGDSRGDSSSDSASARDSESDSTGAAPGESHQVLECTVCYKEFENETSLRKHMRMHGMAFIRSRRLMPEQPSD